MGRVSPGLITLFGLAAIALALIAVLLLPPPGIRSAARRLVPPNTLISSELNLGDLIGMSGTTTQSLVSVADSCRDRFRLGRSAIVGSGISSWSAGTLFGGVRSGTTMPYTSEGFVILVREKTELLIVVASRATNETATHIEIFCERKRKPRMIGTTGTASRFTPPEGIAGSSTSSPLTYSGIFQSSLPFTNITAHYLTTLLKTTAQTATNGTLKATGNGMLSVPKRIDAESATFLARSGTNETVLIHCFRSATSTQTHVLVGCASK